MPQSSSWKWQSSYFVASMYTIWAIWKNIKLAAEWVVFKRIFFFFPLFFISEYAVAAKSCNLQTAVSGYLSWGKLACWELFYLWDIAVQSTIFSAAPRALLWEATFSSTHASGLIDTCFWHFGTLSLGLLKGSFLEQLSSLGPMGAPGHPTIPPSMPP